MTFTLFGRWQIRILLMTTIGLLMAIAIAVKSGSQVAGQTFLTLLYLTLFGIGWDFVYHQLQRFRWDADWNGLLQLAGAIGEGALLILLVKILGLPGLDRFHFNIFGFIGFYSLLCLANFFAATSILRILSPYSRFQGGQWF
jgi:hypothetical protein